MNDVDQLLSDCRLIIQLCTSDTMDVDPGVLQSGLWDAGYMQLLVQKQQELLQQPSKTSAGATPAITQQLRKLLQLYVGVMVLRQSAGSLLQHGTR